MVQMFGTGRKNGGVFDTVRVAEAVVVVLYISFLTSDVICFCNVEFSDLHKFTTGQGSTFCKLYGVNFWKGYVSRAEHRLSLATRRRERHRGMMSRFG